MKQPLFVLSGLVFLMSSSCGDADKSSPSPDSSAKKADSSAAPAKSGKPSASAAPMSSATAVASGAASAAPAGSADPDACPADDKWAPKTAKVTFEWTDKPSLDKAPKDGVYASVGGEPFVLDKISIQVDEKKKEWTLEAKAGPIGPALMLKGEPKAGLEVNEKYASNRGFFQIPSKRDMAECFKQTTSFNGDNARIIKLTKFDAKTKLADGVFVTTWQEGSDKKRKLWAAGTFKDVKVTVF